MKGRMIGLLVLVLGVLMGLTAEAKPLSRKKAEALRQEVIAQWQTAMRERYASVFRDGIIRDDSVRMRVWSHTFGQRPEGGHSLYISLHGGGRVAPGINDEQWGNQVNNYRPAEGVYLCPRAPYNDMDQWFKPAVDGLMEQTIAYALTYLDVNPNRIYLMGYSAGGDGVWRLAPRMADRWAAASMMAGHPGEVALEGLRNTPFMIWCGHDDNAYDRNFLCYMCGEEMDSLQRADSLYSVQLGLEKEQMNQKKGRIEQEKDSIQPGYIHQTHIVPGVGHWMERQDTAALAWMAQFTRNPYPRRIVWCQGDRPHRDFYWLSLPKRLIKGSDPLIRREPKEYQMLRAERDGNTITISESDYPEVTLWLNDEMVDLDRPVRVIYNKESKVVFEGRVERSEEAMRESLYQRGDPSYCFTAKVTVKLY